MAAAVDDQNAAGGITQRGRARHDGRGDVIRYAHPLEWDRGADPFVELGIPPGHKTGVDDAGRDRQYADGGGERLGQRFRRGVDSRLGRGVGKVAAEPSEGGNR